MGKGFLRGLVIAGAVVMGIGSTAALAATPTVAVTPSTNLINGQVVKVSGKGWPKNDSLAIIECNSKAATDGQAACDTSRLVFVKSSATGVVPATNFTVHTGAIGTDGGMCNKANPGCSIVLTELSPTGLHAVKVISFKV